MPNEEQVTPTPGEPVKVVFDEAAKTRINEIVADAQRRAAAESKAESDRLKKELDALKATQPSAPSAETAVELATTRAELSALKAAQQETAIRDTLRAAVGNDFLDGELAANILRSSIKLVDGKTVVVDGSGQVRLGPTLDVMTVTELAKELQTSKPFLVRSRIVGGLGSSQSQSMSTSTGPKLEDLFGPRSNGGAANRLALQNPQAYRAMRARAKEQGLL